MNARHLLIGVPMALLVALGTATPSNADFDAWLKGVMDAPGRHAGKHYPEPRKKRLVRKADPMKALRSAMVSGKELTEQQLGQLVKSGDELAAYKLAQKIEATQDPDRLPEAMANYVVAVNGGRDFATSSIVRLLDMGVGTDDPELLAGAEDALVAEAADDAKVRDQLIRMYRSGEPFGPKALEADAMLVAAAEAGDTEAALDLAYAMLAGVPNPARIEAAKGYLKIAVTAENLSIRTQAENILRGLEPGQPSILTVALETTS
jgi:TPR repeat protein